MPRAGERKGVRIDQSCAGMDGFTQTEQARVSLPLLTTARMGIKSIETA